MGQGAIRLQGEVTLAAAAGDGAPARRRVRILAYGGDLMSVPGWGLLAIDLGGLQLPDDLPILLDHRNELAGIAGVGRPRVAAGELVVDGELVGDTETGQHVLRLLEAGVPLGASVGIEPYTTRNIAAREQVQVNGRILSADAGWTLVEAGRLREVSLVAVPADSDTQVVLARGQTMDTENKDLINATTLELLLAKAKAEGDAVLGGMPEAKHVPAAKLAEVRADFYGKLQTVADRAAAGEIDRKKVEAETNNALLEARKALLRAALPPPIITGGSSRDAGPADLGQIIEAALLRSCGVPSKRIESWYGGPVADAVESKPFRGLGVAKATLMAYSAITNEREPAVVTPDVLRTVLRPGVQAGWSGVDFSGVFANVGSKLALAAFTDGPSAWRMVARVSQVRDFKAAKRFRVTAKGVFELVPEGGELPHGSLKDEAYDVQAKTYGLMFALTRQDIINDDTDALSAVPQMLGRKAALALEKQVFSSINGATFFSAGNGNLLTGAALSTSTYGQAVAKLREQKDLAGDPLALEPRKLLVPPALEGTARTILNSETLVIAGSSDRTQGSRNVWVGSSDPVVTPFIGAGAGGSDTTWYLLTDPAVMAVVEVAFLNGQESPVIESADADFNTLGVQFRGYFDFGVALSEYRAGVKATA